MGREQWWRFVGSLELSLQSFPASIEGLDLGFAFVHGDLVVERDAVHRQWRQRRRAIRIHREDQIPLSRRSLPAPVSSSKSVPSVNNVPSSSTLTIDDTG